MSGEKKILEKARVSIILESVFRCFTTYLIMTIINNSVCVLLYYNIVILSDKLVQYGTIVLLRF